MAKETRLSAATIGCDNQTRRMSRLSTENAERVDQLALLPYLPFALSFPTFIFVVIGQLQAMEGIIVHIEEANSSAILKNRRVLE